MSNSTKRPSVDEKLYEAAQRHCIGEDKTPNECFEESFELLFKENGDMIDGINRLREFCKDNDLDSSQALEHILVKVIDSDGDVNIQFKERMKVDEIGD